jgi:hypothetical protein
MSSTHLPPDDPSRAATARTGNHRDVDDQPFISVSGYRPLIHVAYAVVLYGTAAGRVGAVVAPFADALSAEQYAIDDGFRSYDVVPATAVSRTMS